MAKSSRVYDSLATARYDKIHGPAKVYRVAKDGEDATTVEAAPIVPKIKTTSDPAFHAALKSLGFSTYDRYLEGQHWKGFRRMVLAKRKRCEVCSKVATVVHHKCYERIGCELPGDVVAMCSFCHDQLHSVHRKLGIDLACYELALAKLVKRPKWQKAKGGAAKKAGRGR